MRPVLSDILPWERVFRGGGKNSLWQKGTVSPLQRHASASSTKTIFSSHTPEIHLLPLLLLPSPFALPDMGESSRSCSLRRGQSESRAMNFVIYDRSSISIAVRSDWPAATAVLFSATASGYARRRVFIKPDNVIVRFPSVLTLNASKRLGTKLVMIKAPGIEEQKEHKKFKFINFIRFILSRRRDPFYSTSLM